MVSSLGGSIPGSEEAVAQELNWHVFAESPHLHDNPFEIDEEEIAEALAALPEPETSQPEELNSLEEAEVPAIWFL